MVEQAPYNPRNGAPSAREMCIRDRGVTLVCFALVKPPLPGEGEYLLNAKVVSRPVVEENRVKLTLDEVKLDGHPAGVRLQAYFSNYDGISNFLRYGQHIEVQARIFLPKGRCV